MANIKVTKNRYVNIPFEVLQSIGGREMLALDYAILLELLMRYNGKNNGKLALSTRCIKERYQVGGDAVQKSLRRLHTFGMIVTEKRFPFKSGKSNEYSITWLKNDIYDKGPENLWERVTWDEVWELTKTERNKKRQAADNQLFKNMKI